jgi:acylphosphatase
MIRTVRVVISGRVQRVGYRHWTDRQAHEIGLDGWVRNLPDKTVEALFSGSKDQVKNMIELCFKGPRLAKVDDIKVSPASPPAEAGFIQYRN